MLQDLYTNNAIKTDMGTKRIKQLELELNKKDAEIEAREHEIAALRKFSVPEPVEVKDHQDAETDMAMERIKQLELDLKKKEAEIEARENEIAALRKAKTPLSEPVEVKDHQDTEAASTKKKSKGEETAGLLAKNERIDLDPDDDMLQVNWFLRLCCAHQKMIKAPKVTSKDSSTTLPAVDKW